MIHSLRPILDLLPLMSVKSNAFPSKSCVFHWIEGIGLNPIKKQIFLGRGKVKKIPLEVNVQSYNSQSKNSRLNYSSITSETSTERGVDLLSASIRI